MVTLPKIAHLCQQCKIVKSAGLRCLRPDDADYMATTGQLQEQGVIRRTN